MSKRIVRAETPAPKLLDVENVRRDYVGGASARHVYRLAEEGLMPWGLKLGALRRWRRDELESWVAGGCRPVRGESDSPPKRTVRSGEGTRLETECCARPQARSATAARPGKGGAQ
jgi:predicted DNA-binding transcriptional regulator AlpA